MSLAGGRTVRRLGRNRHPEGLVEILSRQVTKRGFSCGSVCRRIPVNSPSVLVSIRFFGMGKGMGGDISQIKRLYAAITCSNFERTLPPPRTNCPARTHGLRIIPETWVTLLLRKGSRGAPACRSRGRSIRDHSHEDDESNFFARLFNPHLLTGEDGTEIDFLPIEADAPACCHGESLVVERIIELRQSGVGRVDET
jgi:hypothetical protein